MKTNKEIKIKHRLTGKVIFKAKVKTIKEAVELAIKKGINLSFADLSSANLSSANLSFANLSSANLSFANLNSADLHFANLNSADLHFANLSSADLSFANLNSANLRFAKGEFYISWGVKLKVVEKEVQKK
jgi:uncharacterized protein YjbI with pentapeptide repeats